MREPTDDPAARSVDRLLKAGGKLPRAIRDEVLAHGERAVPALVAMLESPEGHAAEHAALLLADLQVTAAVEPLLSLLARTAGTEEPDLPDAPVDALVRLGAAVVEPTLAALARAVDPRQRQRLLRALARCGVREPRLLDALLEEVRRLVPNAALALADYGDPAAAAPLAALYDSLDLSDPGRCTVVLDIAVPLLKLQGELTDAQQDRYTQVTEALMAFVKEQVAALRRDRAASLADVDELVEAGDDALDEDDEDDDDDDGVGRNDPCHCGSGKKFKRCHGADA